MFLSENEIDAQLSALHRQRELIERKIADLLLFRELGRRLADSGSLDLPPRSVFRPATSEPAPADRDAVRTGRSDGLASFRESAGSTQAETTPLREERATPRSSSAGRMVEAGDESEEGRHAHPGSLSERRSPPVPAVPFEEDPVAARRYGRALLEAVLDVLGEVGRPLHAGEILERVVARGFTVPGHDPVAALNTRLWKRSGPGKPLRRLGEAVYALGDPPVA